MAVQHPIKESVIFQDRFETIEVKKDDSFVIINRWHKDELRKSKVIILNFKEARVLVNLLNQVFS